MVAGLGVCMHACLHVCMSECKPANAAVRSRAIKAKDTRMCAAEAMLLSAHTLH